MNSKGTAAMLAAVLTAGLSLAACGGGAVPAASTTTSAARTTAPPAITPAAAPAATTPVAAASTTAAATSPATSSAMSPAGTWNVAYAADPTSILGRYTITEAEGSYTITTATVLDIPDGNCSLPAGLEVGTFSVLGGAGSYAGTERLYEQGTCAFSGTDATLTVTVSGGEMLLTVAGQQTVALTRTGTTTSSPVASAPAATTAAAAARCTVPDVIGAGENGHIGAALAEQDVAHACPPVGLHVVTVLTVSGPAGTPQGGLWKESPAAGSSVQPGSSVSLYFQP